MVYTQEHRWTCGCGHAVERHQLLCAASRCAAIAVKGDRCARHVDVILFPNAWEGSLEWETEPDTIADTVKRGLPIMLVP
jgi:predicted nucleic acid-binding Zn ribbon protein